ncbi:MAG TPA: M20/M25/M40 family metallo-hydrolase [Clostridia bacterium]|nr:M20/M25/M40 family metallo-hydrolase [Clostridia bacterium]HRX43033.1 M20/M25/M40 family metallo-hydrolase [Clostridia bacterium]
MKKSIVEEFMDLVRIDNESLDERLMADFIMDRLRGIGYEPYEDDAGEKAGGTAGNVICLLEGEPELDSVMFLAHMDSVYPCKGKVPIIKDGYIVSEGDTVLGSDDLSGVAAMLNLAQNIKEGGNRHGDIWLVFTIAEEIGLVGARHLDTEGIKADYAYVLDSGGDIGKGTVSAPSHNTFSAVITGRAAHAGMEPEKGINAINVAADAITNMTLGRIDHETTANIGSIEGGRSLNIVCEKVTVKGEVRSRDLGKLEKYSGIIIDSFNTAAKKAGATVEINMEREYNSFRVSEDQPVLSRYKSVLRAMDVEFIPEHSGGGSDTNIIFNKGIQALTISCGMEQVHQTTERISISVLEKLPELMMKLACSR